MSRVVASGNIGDTEQAVAHIRALPAGPEGYPRVLDYSIFKSLLVPYPKFFITRPGSRVVIISPFLSNHSNFQKVER